MKLSEKGKQALCELIKFKHAMGAANESLQRAQSEFDRAKTRYDNCATDIMAACPADETVISLIGTMAAPGTAHLITVRKTKIEFQVLPIIGDKP